MRAAYARCGLLTLTSPASLPKPLFSKSLLSSQTVKSPSPSASSEGKEGEQESWYRRFLKLGGGKVFKVVYLALSAPAMAYILLLIVRWERRRQFKRLNLELPAIEWELFETDYLKRNKVCLGMSLTVE